MVVDVTGMNDSSYESLEELFVDKDTKALLSKWKTSNESGKTKEFETSMITDEEYMKLKEVFKVLHSETEDYSKYRKAFNALCKAAHIVPDGTIIIKYELSKGKDDDRNNLYVKYAENTRPITLPEGTKLYHQSVVGGIKELIPKWKLRGKNEAGYLCDKPRVYLTMSKSLPRISTDNKLKDRLYSYEVVNTPAKVFVDPLLPDIFQKAVYVETETPIPVKPLKSDTILGKIKEKITGDKEEKEEDKKVSEMVVDVTNKEPVNELFGFGKKKEEKKAKYAPFTQDECSKIKSIVKSKLAKYPNLKKAITFDVDNESKDPCDYTVCHIDCWDYPGFDGKNKTAHTDDYEAFTEEVRKAVAEVVKCTFDFYDGDWDDFYITAHSRKPMEKKEDKVNESVESVNEFFGFGKKKEDKKKSKPARKYDLLTEEEFNKCMSIIKKHVNKYSILKDIVSYSGGGIYSTYSEYKNFNSDGVCVAILEWGNDNVPESKMSEYEKQYDSVMKGIESDFAKLPFKVECSNVSDSEWDIICIDVRKPMEKKEDKVNESVESVNEVFGLSKEEKEKKAADRKALSDLEFSYDKKYNAFCLSVSGYSIEKLQTMLDKKVSELEDAKAEKKSAEDRQKKLEAQIKIDYLENVCNRCKAMIKKKKSYHNK